MSKFKDFIIIDDDIMNNILCRRIIEEAYSGSEITDFIDPFQGFKYIIDQYANSASKSIVILLLDINMPLMDAWEFLDRFEKLDDSLKNRIKVHILSSSVNKQDMERAQANKYVEYYLIKPLTKESIRLIVHVLNKKLAGMGQ